MTVEPAGIELASKETSARRMGHVVFVPACPAYMVEPLESVRLPTVSL